jgi:D-beta-D-heptose 7-phosphate kinase/D-beta-D-heptose 1-phosphate adenosyltransferase
MVKKQTAVIVSGYFNPIHKGHIEYFCEAKALVDILFVIVNNDHQRQLKGSQPFQDEDERLIIIQNIKPVHQALLAIDRDRTVCKTIEHLVKKYSETYNFTFANGGDQNNRSIPEAEICEQLQVNLVDGLGDKIQSSSWLLEKERNFLKKK